VADASGFLRKDRYAIASGRWLNLGFEDFVETSRHELERRPRRRGATRRVGRRDDRGRTGPITLADRLIAKAREPAKRVGRPVREAFRRSTARARSLPDFLVIGGQRCGTTSFYDYLTSHRGVMRAADKEVHFFDQQWARGQVWYRSRFPLKATQTLSKTLNGARPLTGEATPYYLFHPHVPRRVHETLPAAKLIVLLRDPVARAHSHYEWMRKHGHETLTFTEALRREAERLEPEVRKMEEDPSYTSATHRHFGYLARGRYAEQLDRWFALFPREQFLIVRSEDFFDRPGEVFATAFEFLGVREYVLRSYPRRGAQKYSSPLAPEVEQYLAEYFREPNERLSELIGRELWPARSRAV
jgi:hypothetical protein